MRAISASRPEEARAQADRSKFVARASPLGGSPRRPYSGGPNPTVRGCVRLSRGLSPRPVVRAPGGASKRPRSRRTPADHERESRGFGAHLQSWVQCVRVCSGPESCCERPAWIGVRARVRSVSSYKLVLARPPSANRGHRLGTRAAFGIIRAGFRRGLPEVPWCATTFSPVGAMDTREGVAAGFLAFLAASASGQVDLGGWLSSATWASRSVFADRVYRNSAEEIHPLFGESMLRA